jgi:hypothetical protein
VIDNEVAAKEDTGATEERRIVCVSENVVVPSVSASSSHRQATSSYHPSPRGRAKGEGVTLDQVTDVSERRET